MSRDKRGVPANTKAKIDPELMNYARNAVARSVDAKSVQVIIREILDNTKKWNYHEISAAVYQAIDERGPF